MRIFCLQPGLAAWLGLTVTAFWLGLAASDARAEETVWKLGEWSPPIAEAAGEDARNVSLGKPAPAPQTTGSLEPIRWGESEVRLGPVGDGHGAEIKPDGAKVRFGLGIAPRAAQTDPALADIVPDRDENAFAGLDNGFTGTIGISENQGNFTQSMSLSAPISGDGGADTGTMKNGLKTMFGLGMKF